MKSTKQLWRKFRQGCFVCQESCFSEYFMKEKRKLLFKLFCDGCYDYVNDKNAKYLQRTLKRLTGEKRLNINLTGTHIVFLFFLRR